MRKEVRAQKRALRREVVARILAMDPADRRRQEALLLDRMPALPGFSEARTVLLYVSVFPEEIPTEGLLRRALELGKTLVCPRVDRAARRLVPHPIDNLVRDFQTGTLGIPEPRLDLPTMAAEAIDWVLVPGIAFDRRGYRLGRGGGYYDRLLPTLRAEAPRWAMALDPQWLDRLPAEPHDQPLDGILGTDRFLERNREDPPPLQVFD